MIQVLGINMKLVPTTENHLRELMGWFPDQRSCVVWGSRTFRYPFTETTFREDVRLELPSYSSYSLVGNDAELLGFGQYYLRAERCHLALLVISPNYRGHGFGEVLIRALCQRGCRQLRVRQCSLFVFSDNSPAISLYARLGFAVADYLEDMGGLEGCIYMTNAQEKIKNWVLSSKQE